MKVAIFGGSGFIGTYLSNYFIEQDADVTIVSRSAKGQRKERIHWVTWDQLKDDYTPLEHCDAWINLAGETINQRWTSAAKRRIQQSRLHSTEFAELLSKQMGHPPRVYLSASAVGIYGTSESQRYTEDAQPEVSDFLSQVTVDWEQAAAQVTAVRTVCVRIGMVLAQEGGALPKMSLPFRLFAGGRMGDGLQWISWIHIEDLARMMQFCIENEQISGPVNASSPHPVTNKAFGRTLSRTLRKPYYLPVPALVMKLVFGEMSDLLLKGQFVLPQMLLDHDFSFRYPELDTALEQLMDRSLH